MNVESAKKGLYLAPIKPGALKYKSLSCSWQKKSIERINLQDSVDKYFFYDLKKSSITNVEKRNLIFVRYYTEECGELI